MRMLDNQWKSDASIQHIYTFLGTAAKKNQRTWTELASHRASIACWSPHPIASHFSPHHTRGHTVESHHPFAPFFWPPGLLLLCLVFDKKTLDKNDQTKTFRIQLRIYHNLSFGRFPEAFHSMISAKNGRWQVRQIRSARSTWNRRKSASHVANWLEDARRKSNQICLLLLSLIVSCNLIAGWSGIAQRAFNWSW
jgi:hypothetical protein